MVAVRLALALLLAVPATAVAQTPTTFPYVNGVVSELLVDGDTLYVGGNFTAAGAAAGPLVLARGSDGALVRSHPGFAQVGDAEAMTVDAVLDDGAGGWYVGGAFARVDGAERVSLVRLRADGTVDSTFAPRLDADTTTSKVSALARHGDILWVGGLSIEGAACRSCARSTRGRARSCRSTLTATTSRSRTSMSRAGGCSSRAGRARRRSTRSVALGPGSRCRSATVSASSTCTTASST